MPTKSYLSEKQVKQVSRTTTERFREPTNPAAADNVTQFTFDHSRNTRHVPGDYGRTTMNRSGKSAALGPLASAQIGGTKNDPSRF